MLKVVCAMVLVMVMACAASSQRRLEAIRARSRCTTHTQVTALIRKGQCRPVDQPVPVPVPEGYETVAPAVVLLPRCDGMACYSGLSCIPLSNHIRAINITIYGYNSGRKRECLEVEMKSHEGCKCECSPTCLDNQMLRSNGCGCQCDPTQQALCERQYKLWDPSTCSCLCPHATPQCSSGQVFIQELCRCENY